jgi:hypothetical protein
MGACTRTTLVNRFLLAVMVVELALLLVADVSEKVEAMEKE